MKLPKLGFNQDITLIVIQSVMGPIMSYKQWEFYFPSHLKDGNSVPLSIVLGGWSQSH